MAQAGEILAGNERLSHRRPSYFLIIIGVLAILLPFVAGVSFTILLGIALILAGLAYGALAFATRGTGAFVLRLLLSLLFVMAGFDLVFHPAASLVGLTLVFAGVFLFEACSEIFTYFRLRGMPGSSWLLMNGLITLLLAVMIWASWPSSSTWAIGSLVGINLVMSGLTPIRFYRANRPILA